MTMRWIRRQLVRLVAAISLITQSVLTAAPGPLTQVTPVDAAPLAAPTNTLHLRVESARAWVPSNLANHQAIPHYRWLIVQDDTGDPTHYGTSLPMGPGNSNFDCAPPSLGGDPYYPENCQWPSIHATTGGTTAQVVAEGDETTLSQTVGLNLANGKYMISVQAEGFNTDLTHRVDGFKIDGNWFSVPLQQPGADPGLVTVGMQPYPLPLVTLRIKVFEDITAEGAWAEGDPPLQGFEAILNDIAGDVTHPISANWFGDPLCTEYQHDAQHNIIFDSAGRPVVKAPGGHCISDANGDIVIKYMAANRWSANVIPPKGSYWVQTTTLEGALDWDIWAQEGWNGFDPEFVPNGEPFPFSWFGFVPGGLSLAGHPDMPTNGGPQYSGAIKGLAQGKRPFSPPIGGTPFGIEAGNKLITPNEVDAFTQPIIQGHGNGYMALLCITCGDTIVWTGYLNTDGSFQVNGLPDGDYAVTHWDLPHDYLDETVATKVVNGQLTDMGTLDQFPWFGTVEGRVCQDLNRNGKCDPGEPGIPGLVVNLLSRDNSLQDSGSNAATTDNNGYYVLREAYPLGQWVVNQAYYEQFYTVGVTYQTNNQPTETTVMANGAFVDVSVYNQVGMKTRLDWAVHTYETDPNLGPTTGGIVGEMVYNTTRIAQDPRMAATVQLPNQPGIPNMAVHLYAPVKCNPATYGAPADGSTCAPMTTSFGTTNYVFKSDGALMKRGEEIGNTLNGGKPIDMNPPYTSETWQRPVGCPALDVNGNPVLQQLLPNPSAGTGCLEAPLMSNMVSNNTLVDINGNTGRGQFVNGNYGFVTITNDPNTGAILTDPVTGFATSLTIPEGDWIVEPQGPQVGTLWRPAMEEDINIFSGDEYVAPGETPVNPPHPIQPQFVRPPQPTPQIPPHPCVGPTHTVNVVTNNAQAKFDPLHPHTSSGVYNPDFAANHGSPYEGQLKPVCGDKLVTVKKGRSATPNFFWMPVNNVQLPGRIHGLITDDLNAETNPKKLFFGEKAGIGNIPIGIYDFANRLVTTIQTDPNGIYEVLLPSTSNASCPVPASMCPGVYRLVANDPGQPGHLNPGFNPQYRTMAVFQQVWPGITLTSDLAPTPVSTAVESPGSQNATMTRCLLNDPTQPTAPKIPEIYAVSTPYGPVGTTFTIKGQYFGAGQEDGRVTLEAVADPNKGPALALNATAGGTLVNGTTYDFAFAWRTTLGTTVASPRRHLAADANRRIDVIAPPAPLGVAELLVYIGNHDGPLYLGGRLLNPSTTASNTVTISAPPNAGNAQPSLFNGTQVPAPVVSWNDRQITVRVPNTVPPGPHQLTVSADNGMDENRGLNSSVNGLTFHVIDPTAYNPTILNAGPGKTYDPTTDPHALQHAVDAAAKVAGGQVLLVMWPNTPGLYNPFGGYNENIIIHSPVKLQGVGPGGVYPDGSSVVGSVIDGNGFGTDNQRTTDWETLMNQLQVAGLATHPTPPEAIPPVGEVIMLVATSPTQYTDKFKASIDGLTVTGGDVADFVALLNEDGGGPEPNLFDPLDPFFTNNAGEPQGSGIVAWAYTQHLLVTNDIIRSNSGAYAGAIRLGTPYVGDNNLDGIQIAHNRIIANGGSNLAGAIGIFAGSDNYSVNNNDICGNFSAEYGGGVSHFGLSSYGRIHDNRIYWNGSYDEGAGIMIAGELPLPAGAQQRAVDDVDGPPAPPSGMSPGSGSVDVYNNVLQGNLSGDDGGGLRLLMVGNYAINIFNNIIANNTATHEGGGVSIDDAPNTRFYNNTVVKNITTSTAITSDGKPKPAGLSTERNSTQLQNYLVSLNAPQAAVNFSEPVMFNNIFCDNRAGSWDGANMRGIHNTNYGGLTDPGPINYWDIGTIDGTGPLHPTNSVLQPNSNPGIVADASNKSCPTSSNPSLPPDLSTLLKSTMDIGLYAIPYRGDPKFVGNVSISVDVPNSIMGDYHLALNASNPAIDSGAASKAQFGQTISAPQYDIDNQRRPSPPAFEIGADEVPPEVLDEFARADGPLGPNWLVSQAVGGVTPFAINNGQVRAQAPGVAIWNPTVANPAHSPNFGANQEAYLTLSKLGAGPSVQGLVLKFNNSSGTTVAPTSLHPTSLSPATASGITVTYEPYSKMVIVATYEPGKLPQLWATIPAPFSTGDTLMAKASANGDVLVYRNGTLVGKTNVVTGTNPFAPWLGSNTPWPYAAKGGEIGVAYATKANDANFTNFGGGTLP